MGGNDDGPHGTGHEDEYQGGRSPFWMMNPYSLPLLGKPKAESLIDVFGQVNGSTTAYRFWPGKIPYTNSIRTSTKHGKQRHLRATDSRTSGLRDEWLRTRSKSSV